ncbi:protein kinase A regulatory subunit, putative [Trypanosoma brucei gambiense DAL972]|uniref:Protein kinase A regulatory subunit, putative n=1 Tax=Trypanosoma brucei gambiense (strain MHOM/CI/86/DAL972) TaxID=679716 RepID=D0A6V7_TRYB9|nr:protein kinase A regulatory subunit, putative [Trypanosoma brucei gambiense DAL972]CBH17408.1 protein kinase A regulatory subunit, putative [Trypanosoma brucei gambiense DAL972]|eukprot:XP_011779672.1 protein kinase A regulatory subunit, putative [Trypanosoma brucei gambiense DAL972]
MSEKGTSLNLFLAACQKEGVKQPNTFLVEFFTKKPELSEVEEIDLSKNYIGNRGILALLDVISELPCFRFLNCSNQKLYNTDLNEDSVRGNATIDRIVDVFKSHPTANALDLSHNPISNYAGRRLLLLTQNNKRICRVELVDTRIDFELRSRITQQCEKNTIAIWESQAQEKEEERAFGESVTWVPTQTSADLTAIGGGRKRRTTVRGEGIDPERAKSYVAPYFEKSEDETALILKLLTYNVLFSFLDSRDLMTVAGAMWRVEFKQDDCIMEAGQTTCDKLYIIQDGKADIIKEGQKVYLKVEGTAVGELELMYQTPTVATVKVCTPELIAWALDRDTYRHLVMGSAIRRRETYIQFLTNIPFLSGLDNYEKLQLADALSSDEFEPGDYIIRYGEEGEWLYIILEGSVDVVGRDDDGNEKHVWEFGKGDHVGELEFLNNHANVADVVAKTHVVTAKLNRRHFEMCLGPVIDVLKRTSQQPNYEYYQSKLKTTLRAEGRK